MDIEGRIKKRGIRKRDMETEWVWVWPEDWGKSKRRWGKGVKELVKPEFSEEWLVSDEAAQVERDCE